MKESQFQTDLIWKIKEIFNGAVVIKTDPAYIQGFPDLIVFHKNKWAALECKRSANAPHRPNQEYWLSILNHMSYASFVYPENVEEVLYELQLAFGS